MDLLEFDAQPLYFDAERPAEVDRLIGEAGDRYAAGDAEPLLLRAYFLAPQSLDVLVALYRFYYYQHRLEDALLVAQRAMNVVEQTLTLPADWRLLQLRDLEACGQGHRVLVRFYLFTLKAAGYLNLRLGNQDLGREQLEKVAQVDRRDRLGAAALLEVVA